MYARITVDANGCLTPESTCTIDGMTAPVPVGSTNTGRIERAIEALDWEPVWPMHAHLIIGRGYIEVLVDLPGGQG